MWRPACGYLNAPLRVPELTKADRRSCKRGYTDIVGVFGCDLLGINAPPRLLGELGFIPHFLGVTLGDCGERALRHTQRNPRVKFHDLLMGGSIGTVVALVLAQSVDVVPAVVIGIILGISVAYTSKTECKQAND